MAAFRITFSEDTFRNKNDKSKSHTFRCCLERSVVLLERKANVISFMCALLLCSLSAFAVWFIAGEYDL